MSNLDDQLLARYRDALTWPPVDCARFQGDLLIVTLPQEQFAYRTEAGYAFETSCKAHVETGECLLFIRIDEWDPSVESEPDYCIPMAYDGAPESEQLRWTIGFGGAWSHTREAALLVFDASWRDVIARAGDRIVFANPGGTSGALFRAQDRQRPHLERFVRVASA